MCFFLILARRLSEPDALASAILPGGQVKRRELLPTLWVQL